MILLATLQTAVTVTAEKGYAMAMMILIVITFNAALVTVELLHAILIVKPTTIARIAVILAPPAQRPMILVRLHQPLEVSTVDLAKTTLAQMVLCSHINMVAVRIIVTRTK